MGNLLHTCDVIVTFMSLNVMPRKNAYVNIIQLCVISAGAWFVVYFALEYTFFLGILQNFSLKSWNLAGINCNIWSVGGDTVTKHSLKVHIIHLLPSSEEITIFQLYSRDEIVFISDQNYMIWFQKLTDICVFNYM